MIYGAHVGTRGRFRKYRAHHPPPPPPPPPLSFDPSLFPVENGNRGGGGKVVEIPFDLVMISIHFPWINPSRSDVITCFFTLVDSIGKSSR